MRSLVFDEHRLETVTVTHESIKYFTNIGHGNDVREKIKKKKVNGLNGNAMQWMSEYITMMTMMMMKYDGIPYKKF